MDETCGSRVLSTSGKFVEVLNFRHFARYMSFTPTGKQGKKKQIMKSIEERKNYAKDRLDGVIKKS